jgi:hypothetical protein
MNEVLLVPGSRGAIIEPGMAAAPELPDFGALALELIQLEHRANDLRRQHTRIVDRLATFPNEFTAAKERELAAELRELIGRMRRIEAQLRPLRPVS